MWKCLFFSITFQDYSDKHNISHWQQSGPVNRASRNAADIFQHKYYFFQMFSSGKHLKALKANEQRGGGIKNPQLMCFNDMLTLHSIHTTVQLTLHTEKYIV